LQDWDISGSLTLRRFNVNASFFCFSERLTDWPEALSLRAAACDEAANRKTTLPEKLAFPRLVMLDLDGTLLGGDGAPYARIPAPMCEFLDGLVGRGCDWAINTAWDIRGQWELVLSSPVRSRPSFLVAELGRCLARVVADGPELVQPYTRTMNHSATDAARKYMAPLLRELCARHDFHKVNYYGHLLTFEAAGDPQAFQRDASARYAEAPGLHVAIDAGRLSASLACLHKGLGLAEVARLEGYAPCEVVVAGDEVADIAMMNGDCASHAICPSNAHAAVKAHAERMGGVVASQPNAKGVIEGFATLAERYGWTAPTA